MEIPEKYVLWRLVFEKIACSYKRVISLEINLIFLSLQEPLIGLRLGRLIY